MVFQGFSEEGMGDGTHVSRQAISSIKIGVKGYVRNIVAPGLYYLASLSSYLAILLFTTMKSNMILSSATEMCYQLTPKYMESQVFLVSGRESNKQKDVVRMESMQDFHWGTGSLALPAQKMAL